MLLNYKFKNFMSFRENVEFSMLAPKSKVKNRFPDHYISMDDGTDILKNAVIVGENAGGKSNFIRSLIYFQSLFKHNDIVRAYRNIVNTNNNKEYCFKENNTLQSFDIEIFIKEKGIYQYHLEFDHVGIVNEFLNYKKQMNHKYNSIFFVNGKTEINCRKNKTECERRRECKAEGMTAYRIEVKESSKELVESLEQAVNKGKTLGLIVSKLAILGNEYALSFTEWMQDFLYAEANIINYDIYKSLKNEEEDIRILQDARYLEIFRMVDYSIIGFKLDEEKPFSKTQIIRRRADGNTFSRELKSDSSGVQEFFAWAVQIFKVVYEDKIVFADEMDRVLNPVLSDRVISFITGKKHYGQFIFTTHNVLHLDLKNFMKEQIYFITKDVETLDSELYSLADFPEIRYETTKVYEFYLKGILGGTQVE